MSADEIWRSPAMGGLRIVGHWRTVNQWWTPTPVTREWQEVVEDGRAYVRYRDPGGPWVYDYDVRDRDE